MNAPAMIPSGYRRCGFVYCIRNDAAGAVKIGFSKNPMRRIKQLQTASPSRLRLVGMLESAQAFETALHEEYAHRRISGEWFDDSDTQISTIMALIYGDHE